MRVVHTLAAVMACGLIAVTSGLLHSAPSRAASVEAGAAGPAPAAPPVGLIEVRHASSVDAHYAAANTTHDGHLTREQALQADWPKVARHFDEIDVDHKGWISVEQIHQFNRAHGKGRAKHRAPQAA